MSYARSPRWVCSTTIGIRGIWIRPFSGRSFVYRGSLFEEIKDLLLGEGIHQSVDAAFLHVIRAHGRRILLVPACQLLEMRLQISLLDADVLGLADRLQHQKLPHTPVRLFFQAL